MPIGPMFTQVSGGQLGVPGSSESHFDLVLKRSAPISRPIDVARALESSGLGLADAHRALDRLVADETVGLTLRGPDRATMIAELAELGVSAD